MGVITNIGALLIALFLSLFLPVLVQDASAQSASVRYSISPAARSVQPGGTVNITVSVQTDVEIAGGSVNLVFNNASYDNGFQSANPPGIYFIDYKSNFNDLLFICSDNRCAPGTYELATITIKVGNAGSAGVTFNPKETADPSLNLISASGTSGSYSISGSAPQSPPKPRQNTYTIPNTNPDGETEPLEVTNEQYVERQEQSQRSSNNPRNGQNEDSGSDEADSFWSSRNIIIAGITVSLAFIIGMLLLAKFYLGGGPKGPGGPTITPGGPSNIYYR